LATLNIFNALAKYLAKSTISLARQLGLKLANGYNASGISNPEVVFE
jgi:hypothetical protein